MITFLKIKNHYFHVNLCPLNVLRRFLSDAKKSNKSTKRPSMGLVIKDMIGPPDPDSNLRPIVRYRSQNETPLEKELRESQNEMEKWNQEFWKKHNKRFLDDRQQFIKSKVQKHSDESNLTADEMSVFYKDFLDRHWQTHVKYNFQWYQKNMKLLILALRVNVQRVFQKR